MTYTYEPLARVGKEGQSSDALDTPSAFLQFAIATLLVGAVGAYIVLRILAPDPGMRLWGPLLMLVLAVLGWGLLARGKVSATVKLLAYGAWLAVTAIAVLTHGVRAPVMAAYPVIIFAIGWLIGPRQGLFFSAVTVLATVSLWFAESRGLLAPPAHDAAEMHVVVQALIAVLSGGMIVFLVRAYQKRLQELRAIGRDLAASQEELQRAQAVAKVGSWGYDMGSSTARLSAEACRILGLPQGASESHQAYLERIHPQDRAGVERAWRAALKQGDLDHEHRILVGGEVRWVRQKAQMGRAADGRVLHVLGITQDITDRRQAQEALKANEQRFQSLSTISSDWFWQQDAQFRFTEFSGAFSSGFTPLAKSLGKTRWELDIHLSPEQWAAHRAILEAHLPFKNFEYDITGEYGEVRWYSISGAPLFDEAGHFIGYHGTGRNITERKKADQRIEELAFYDQLTGLPNRTLLLDRLTQTMASRAHRASFSALLFVDLDNFKTLNDSLGHGMGDLLLKQVAQRLTQCVRAQDTVARFGGDEFVVMLVGLGVQAQDAAVHAEAVGGKILAALNQGYQLNGVSYHGTPSIGATLFCGGQVTVEDVIKQVELAMYKAKGLGRNALHFYDPALEAAVMARAALEADLRQAVQERQFLLHYQAQVLDDGGVTGAEALVRWQHPQRGLVSPAEFIPLAEETGLILGLGQWVLETVCTQLAQWASDPAMAQLSVAVNVSAQELRDPGFVQRVLTVISQTQANPARLKLELTESMLVDDVEDTIAKMKALKAQGIGFSLDDFGTGYSSLSYLKRLPLDQLKIDQSFIKDILGDPDDAAIAKMIIALAQSLGLAVIAEGVETTGQRDYLASQGCHAYQGYLYSRPLPLSAFEPFVRASPPRLS
ncbi:MAG: EAL domain-containing protein [Rhodoferax sp.]